MLWLWLHLVLCQSPAQEGSSCWDCQQAATAAGTPSAGHLRVRGQRKKNKQCLCFTGFWRARNLRGFGRVLGWKPLTDRPTVQGHNSPTPPRQGTLSQPSSAALPGAAPGDGSQPSQGRTQPSSAALAPPTPHPAFCLESPASSLGTKRSRNRSACRLPV